MEEGKEISETTMGTKLNLTSLLEITIDYAFEDKSKLSE
jgi:hypothetical protein